MTRNKVKANHPWKKGFLFGKRRDDAQYRTTALMKAIFMRKQGEERDRLPYKRREND